MNTGADTCGICGRDRESCGRDPQDLHVAGAKDDAEKLRFELIPPEALTALAAVLTYGARKYVPDGWRKVGGARERYTGALMRHLNAWRGGERSDPESELHHLSHVLCNAAFLVALCLNNLTDEERRSL